jgi:SAM-dependent methyltransferase
MHLRPRHNDRNAVTVTNETDAQIAWPLGELEHLGVCPVCQSPERRVYFTGLTDRVFGGAPGAWTLWRCDGCSAAYLDPRPSPESIGRAYEIYYLHRSPPPRGLAGRIRGRIGEVLRNDYLNHRFGYALKPSVFFGRYVTPGRGWLIDNLVRHLPPPAHPGARLLEIGPGGGRFLQIARSLGYCVEGLEPDPKAVETCRRAGFDVREGGVPGTALPENAFEHVLLNHVFEHLHYPVAALEVIWKALRPGGRLWMSMPNLAATGLQRWGRNWMPLDPPRHLVLYDGALIEKLLRRFDFHDIQFLDSGNHRAFTYVGSWKIETGKLALVPPDLTAPPDLRREIERGEVGPGRESTNTESFTVVAFKPAASASSTKRAVF